MPTRKFSFSTGEYYHIYNRGVDKRVIFKDDSDLNRFFQSMKEFNAEEPIRSIYELEQDRRSSGGRTSKSSDKKLVEFVCYCLNPNHFHFLLRQLVDGGISEFMKRMGGYVYYFNKKYERSGALYQGKFKASHISSNEYLLHLSAYVNLNDRVHSFGDPTSKSCSSWNEYSSKNSSNFCNTDIIVSQFENIQRYRDFAERSLEDIIRRRHRHEEDDLLKMLHE